MYYFMNIGDSLCDVCTRVIKKRNINKRYYRQAIKINQSAMLRLKNILRDDGQTVCISDKRVPSRAFRSGHALFADNSLFLF